MRRKREAKPKATRPEKADPTVLSKMLSELYGEPIGPDETREIAANITAFFELLAELDDAQKRRQGGGSS